MTMKIEPYTGPLASCPKCGNGAPPTTDAPQLTEEMLESMPFNVPVRIVHGGALRVRYCPGGKKKVETSGTPLKSMSVAEVLREGLPLVLNFLRGSSPGLEAPICEGAQEEHLHIHCTGCCYEWLTHTLDKSPPNLGRTQ